jgi:hypothetical protein
MIDISRLSARNRFVPHTIPLAASDFSIKKNRHFDVCLIYGSIINGVDEVNFINAFFCEKCKKKDK